MKEFNEHGERVEPPKQKRFNFFSGYAMDGKGVEKDDIITNYDFISFFKLYGRRFMKLIWVNALYIVGNFPVFFLLLAFSGIAVLGYTIKYNRSRKKLAKYYRMLKRLRTIYREEKEPLMVQDGQEDELSTEEFDTD